MHLDAQPAGTPVVTIKRPKSEALGRKNPVTTPEKNWQKTVSITSRCRCCCWIFRRLFRWGSCASLPRIQIWSVRNYTKLWRTVKTLYFTLSGSVATVTWEYIVDLQEIETLEKHYFFRNKKVVPPPFSTFRTQKPHFLGLATSAPPPLYYGLVPKFFFEVFPYPVRDALIYRLCIFF